MSSAIFRSPLPYLALLIAHLIWGANFVVAKITLQEIPVMSLGFLRYTFAFLLLIPFLITDPRIHNFIQQKKSKKKKLARFEHLPKLFAAGFFMVTLNIALFYEGMVRSEAINASVISLALPMLSVLGGWWFLKEKIYFINLSGITVGLLGALIVIGLPLIFVGQVSGEMLLGNLLIFLSCVSSVTGLILTKDLLKEYSPLFVTAALFAVGSITFLIPAVLEYFNNPSWISNVSILGFLGLLYITILSSICAFFLLIWAVEKTNVVQANLFQYIEPAIAATLAVPLLGERISYSFIVGTCLVVLGVYWGTLGKPQHHHLNHKHHRS